MLILYLRSQTAPGVTPGRDIGRQDEPDHLAGEGEREPVRAGQQPRAHRPAGVRGLLRGRPRGQARLQGGRSGGGHEAGLLDHPRRAQSGAQRRPRGSQQGEGDADSSNL